MKIMIKPENHSNEHPTDIDTAQFLADLKTQYAHIETCLSDLLNQYNLLKSQNDALMNLYEVQTQSVVAQWQANSNKFQHSDTKIQKYFNELNFADLLHDTIIQSPWLKDKTFSLFGWAANYSFIYTLYRILDKIQPTNILEMGLGQTTRLTSQYIAFKNPKAHLVVCEHNADWINIYKPELPIGPNADIHHFDLEYFEYDNKPNDKYAHLTEYVQNQKFDLIIVDGPVGGGKNLPRSNILDLIQNNNLADDFVIIFDDAERAGEQATIAKAQDLLCSKSIAFSAFDRQGIKRQHVLTSLSRDFARYL